MEEILLRYPDVKVISTEQAYMMMHQFGFTVKDDSITVKEGDSMTFGKHTIAFVEAPMVHWPEAMVSFDTTDGVLFSADAFGSFKALDGAMFSDEVDFRKDWIDEARRYYTNIVGKYGPEVMHLLNKAGGLDIKMICPLHGLVWRDPDDIGYIIDKYVHWATYKPEETGCLIVYASMYGDTEAAAQLLASKLVQKGMTKVKVYDVSKTPVSYLVSDTFKYSHLAILSVTYNLKVFPPMQTFIDDLARLNMQKRVVALVENGSWAPQAGDLLNEQFDRDMKQMTVLNEQISILSSVDQSRYEEFDSLADSIIESTKQSY